ncbi:MAG TPA: O-antigen ligase family protein [Puia sp.]|nr:O-antigen ligase family protein [Puia sp.]
MEKLRANHIMKMIYISLVMFFLFAFILAIRPLVGLATILLTATAIFYYRWESGNWWNPVFFNPFILGLYCYFALQAFSLFYTHNLPQGWSMFQTDLGIIVLPIAVRYGNLVNQQVFGKCMRAFVYMLIMATATALIYGLVEFARTGDPGSFFYHRLVGIYSGHAIQFSVMVFAALLFLIDELKNRQTLHKKGWIVFMILYLSLFLFLLSSKLVIIIYFLYLVYLFTLTKSFIRKKGLRFSGLIALSLLVTVVYLTNTPFRQRVKEAMSGSEFLFRQQKFSPEDYFNGVQFRLVNWRFVYEILNERQAWITGVTPGDSQEVLAEKYKSENLFAGGVGENKTGYLEYHSHNQFLQAVLESGLPGLLFFMIACVGLIILAIKSQDRSFIAYTVLLLCNCFTDAPLRTQYGIILFVFFPLFMEAGRQKLSVPPQLL